MLSADPKEITQWRKLPVEGLKYEARRR